MPNTAEYRPVSVGALHDGLRVVTEGLEPGEQIIVSGLQRLRPGIAVDPKPMTTPPRPRPRAGRRRGGEARPRQGPDERIRPSRPSSLAPATRLDPDRATRVPSPETRPVFSQFFIDRPIFAAVLSIVITLAGGIAVFTLPLAQYPQITPPTVQVDCNYPGASAQVVAETVAAPIEQQVNGVEDMLYMSSQCTNDGRYNLTVTFKHGVDLNMAQVLVQNRVNLALPHAARRGQADRRHRHARRSPDILLAVSLNSPDGRYDQLYLSNYASLQLKDELAAAARRQRRASCSASATTACGSGSTPSSWPPAT